MKTKNIYLKITGILAIVLLLISCNKDSTFHVDQVVEDAFNKRYPNASHLEWEITEGFVVGEFRNEGFHCKVWFNADGEWFMTETSDLVYDRNLPDHIRADFEKRYDKRSIDDIYKVEFSNVQTRYIIEVDLGDTETNLFYLETGEMFKQITGTWNNRPIVIPAAILNYIASNYERGTIIYDAEIIPNRINVKVFEKRSMTICFQSASQWLAAYWSIAERDISSQARNKLSELLQTGEQISAIYQVEYKGIDGVLYAFKINDGVKIIYIKADGTQVEIEEKFL